MSDTPTTTDKPADKPDESKKDDKPADTKPSEAKPSSNSKDDDVEFDGPYDEERAKRKIAAQAADLRAAKAKLAEVEAAEQAKREAEMTEAQKAAARAEKAEERAAELERELLITKVSKETGVPEDLLKESGHKDDKGLRAYAEKLTAFKGTPAKDEKKPAPGAKPKPGLKPGSGSGTPEGEDVSSIAARIKSRRRH